MFYRKKIITVVLKLGFVSLVFLSIFYTYTDGLSEINIPLQALPIAMDPLPITPEEWVKMGALLVFGTDQYQSVISRGGAPIGKGQCPLCHVFFANQKFDRCPNLVALSDQVRRSRPDLSLSIEKRSHLRVQEKRYKTFMKKLVNGEDETGIIPHAKTGGEYLIESQYCPSCYITKGYGLKGTNDMVSSMPIIHRPPIELSNLEVVAIVAFLQSMDTPSDYSKVTAKESWESYFGQPLSNIFAPP